MRKLHKRIDILIAALFFLAAIPAQRAEVFSLLEDQTISFRHLLRQAYGDAKALALPPEIVLVNTDEKFFKKYKSFPLRRTDLGRIALNLKTLGAKVVAIDSLMDFPSSYGEDPMVAALLRQAGNTLLVAQADIRDGKPLGVNLPTAEIDASAPSGYTNISSSSALVTSLSGLRIYPEATAMRGGWPFSVQAAAMYLGVEPKLEPGFLKLGELAIPLDRFNRLHIDFPPLPAGTRFLSQSAGISAIEFLDIDSLDDRDREELAAWVKGRVVVMGDTSEVSHDWFDTPVGMVYGVEIIADTIATILKGGPLRPASDASQAAVALVAMLALCAVSLLGHPVLRIGIGTLLVGGFVALASYAYVAQGVVFPMSYVLLAAMGAFVVTEFYQQMMERNQKRQISRTFGQYIPAELVEEMNKSGETVSVGGESREMTVLFSDVRGFTTISEGLAPQELTVLMNAFLSPMTRVIHRNRGTIDKYMGDAIMAFWGAPLHDPLHARHAVEAALEMVAAIDDLAAEFQARGWKPIKVGIGLNTGMMNVGNMGSDFRLAYTVMGDAVNLGSRLESLTKQYGVLIIVSEFTLRAVPDLIARELDSVKVKGKDIPVTIFEPLGFQLDEKAAAALADYHDALALYRAQDWEQAKARFQVLAEEEPERLIHRMYLERIAHFEEWPPGAGWDGVYTHTSK